MAGSAGPASVYQVGTQAAFDTAVAATAKLAVPRVEFEPTDNVNRPQLANGLMVRNPGDEFVVARGTNWRVPAFPLSYEQLPGWFGLLIEGGVSSVDGMGPGPYTWTFTRNPAALPALSIVTLERRLTEFTNHIDEEWANAVLTRGTISGQSNGEVQLAADGFAGARANSTLTAALTMPATEHIPFALSELYMDSSWANMGNTQVTGQVLNWSIEILTGAVGLAVADGRATLDYGVLVYDGRQIGHRFRARLLQDKTKYEAERAAAEALSVRAVRVSFDGTDNRAANIDLLGKYERGSLQRVDESDGQVVYDIELLDATDGTNSLEGVVVTEVDDEWGIAP